MGGRTTFQPRAHPRSRGENTVCSFTPGMSGGSSPLTRGKRFSARSSSDASGLIPAHAGKTPRRGGDRRCIGAHPRSRGENRACVHRAQPTQGSSPLTRGKPKRLAPWLGCPRLIPAHAGKTRSMRRRRSWLRAHPRSRGENLQPRDCLTVHMGSSPLTRGKPQSTTFAVPSIWAHPRSRGENMVTDGKVSLEDGSSPLTRGKRKRPQWRSASWGLIPAHAGKTTRPASLSQPTTAHPRSRGENGKERRKLGALQGSSPLTRGKRCHAWRPPAI